jgi:hypothetical protein
MTSTTPEESLKLQLVWEATSASCNLATSRSLTTGRIALYKELSHLETSVRQLELAAFIKLGFMGFSSNSWVTPKNGRQE